MLNAIVASLTVKGICYGFDPYGKINDFYYSNADKISAAPYTKSRIVCRTVS